MCYAAIPYIISAVASVAGGVAAKKQSDYQAKVARNNAEIATRKAGDAETQGQHERDKLRLETARALARGRLAYAAGGVDLGGGGSVDAWQLDVAKSLEIDEQNSIYNAEQRKQAFMDQRQNFLAEAAAAKASGRNAMTAGILGAAASVAGGFSAQSQANQMQSLLGAGATTRAGTEAQILKRISMRGF